MAPTPSATWRDVEVDGARVRLMEAGSGTPLLFLHGWGVSPRCYAPTLLRLAAAGVRVLAPCLPGFGGSDRLPFSLVGLPAYAARIGRLLDVLGTGAPLFVAGHSFGAGVALQLATDRPELVRALTAVSPVGGAPVAGVPLLDTAWLHRALGVVDELDGGRLARTAPSVLRDFLPNALRRPLTLALAGRVALTASLAAQAEALVERGLPLLFVWGDGDRVLAPGVLAGVTGAMPTEVVAGRHSWLLSRPAESAALLGAALRRQELLERGSRASTRTGGATVTALADLPRPRRAQTDGRLVG